MYVALWAEPPNSEFLVFAVEKRSPEEMLTISGADRFVVAALPTTRDIYEPIVP